HAPGRDLSGPDRTDPVPPLRSVRDREPLLLRGYVAADRRRRRARHGPADAAAPAAAALRRVHEEGPGPLPRTPALHVIEPGSDRGVRTVRETRRGRERLLASFAPAPRPAPGPTSGYG